MRGQPDTRVYDYGQVRLLNDDFDLCAGLDAPVCADGRTERHERGSPRVLQTHCQNGVGIHVRHNLKSLRRQNLCGFERVDGVGEKIVRVGVDFELHEIAEARRPPEPRDSHCLVGVYRAACVGQNKIVGKRGIFVGLSQAYALERNRRYRSFRSRDGLGHNFGGRKFPRPDKQARRKLAPADYQLV